MSVPTTDSAMYQTIHRQPAELRRLLAEGWATAGEAADRLVTARRIFLVGIGTSYHAALVGSWLLRAAGSDARAINSFDFALYRDFFPLADGDAVVVMAHSGVKRFSSEAMARARAAGVPVISVGSLTAEHPDSQLVLRTVEREKSAAFTASHLAAMTVLAQVAIELRQRHGATDEGGLRSALEKLPDQVADVLRREEEIVPIAREASRRLVYAVGAGPNEATATEAVIKVREAAYGTIDALPIEQFLHGPIVTVNRDDLAVVIHVPGAAAERVAQIVAVLGGIGVPLWLIGQGVPDVPNATLFSLPTLPEVLSPLLAVVPVQLLAYHMAAHKGVHPDTFRRDNPTYAAAFGLIKL